MCGSHARHPSLCATAILVASSDSLSPTETRDLLLLLLLLEQRQERNTPTAAAAATTTTTTTTTRPTGVFMYRTLKENRMASVFSLFEYLIYFTT